MSGKTVNSIFPGVSPGVIVAGAPLMGIIIKHFDRYSPFDSAAAAPGTGDIR